MTSDTTHTYQWNAEGRLVSFDGGATLGIVYNALGQRVMDIQPEGSTTRLLSYPVGILGRSTGVFDDRPSINWVGWDQFQAQVAGQQVKMGGSTSWLRHSDAVGTTTMVTDQTGAVDWDVEFYPWGQAWQQNGSFFSDIFGNMGDPINIPNGTDPTPFRNYQALDGRWLSPDKLGGDVTDPQSLNRYAYVDNNPASFNDPLGLSHFLVYAPANDCSYLGLDCGGYDTNPGDPCAYVSSIADASCQQPPGLWDNGQPIFPPYLGGYGGGGGSIGGGGTAASAPPAGQPPLGGIGGENPFGCPFPYNSMGLCGLSPNYWTGQIGASVNFTLPWWGLTGTYYFGLAFDLHGNIAAYYGGGLGHGVGASGSAGVQVGDSSAYTVCGLRGPFAQVSGTAGADAGGTIEVFEGKGNGPGGVVRGGTVTLGPTEGASSSIQGTATGVIPFHGHCGNGGLQ